MLNHHTLSDCFPVKRLDQVADFLDNRRKPVKASDRIEGDYAYYGANGQQGTIDDYIFDEPLVLLAEDGGNFDNPDRPIAYIAEGKYWVNNHAHVLRPKSDTNIRYLFWCLAFYDVMPFIKGATRAKLNKSDASRIPIPLPPIEEQRRIVEILDAAQGLIDQRKEQLALMDQLVQSLFYNMFGDPVANPMGWEKKELKKVCSKITDGEHGTVKRVDHGVMYLMARNVMKDGSLSTNDVSYISEDDYTKINKRCNPEPEDLLLVCVGATIGKLTLVPDGFPPFSIARSVALLKPMKTSISPSYLFSLLNTERMQNVILENRNTSAQAGLYLGKIKPISICVPPLSLQTEFAERVEKIEAQKAAMAASLSELEDTFHALMQRAFKGEL